MHAGMMFDCLHVHYFAAVGFFCACTSNGRFCLVGGWL